MHGSALLRDLIPNRKFPFPKSLYAVEDALRIVDIRQDRSAVILDFFCWIGDYRARGHATEQAGRWYAPVILVTNNEVAADEQRMLREEGLRPGRRRLGAMGDL